MQQQKWLIKVPGALNFVEWSAAFSTCPEIQALLSFTEEVLKLYRYTTEGAICSYVKFEFAVV